jgi:hypothetical protein
MQNNNISPNKLNEAVKEALNSDFESYSDDDWGHIQPQLSSGSSSLNPLNNLDIENLVKTNFEEHKKNILYAALATLLIIVVIIISYNSNEYSNETDVEPIHEVQHKETPIIKDTVRGIDTLKTISSLPIKKTIKDSSVTTMPIKAKTQALPQIEEKKKEEAKAERKEEKKNDTTKEKTTPKLVKKKKNENENTSIEEIDILAPKPTMTVTKKKRPKDSVDNPKITTPQPIPQTIKEEQPTSTISTTEKKEADPIELEPTKTKKRKTKRTKKETLPDDQKPKTLQEVVEEE